MPKNSSWGQNTKAVEAKARKATALKTEQEKKQRAVEDAYWEDDDKHVARKQNRKEDREKKRLEKLDRKTTSKQLADEELESVAKSTQKATKVTQAEINAERERREAAARRANASAAPVKTARPAPIEENLNRLNPPDEEARTVDEALKMLKISGNNIGEVTPDKHPERRVRAAYTAFEEARLAQYKAENPSLKLSQIKQLIYTEWKKSPENPMNQARAAYNAKLRQGAESDDD